MPVTIVGVLPPDFTGIQQTVSDGHDVAVPLALDGQLSTGPAEQSIAHESADLLVASGDGPSEAGRRPPHRCTGISKACSSRPREPV